MAEKLYTDKNGEYLKKNPTWHIEDSPWKANHILNMIQRNTIDPKSIAEVGCGAGEILRQLQLSMSNDIKFTGYDISNDAILLARERENEKLEIKQEDFLQTDERFDVLLVIDVFEHVDDYLGFLRACRSKAKNIIFHIPLDLSVNAVLRRRLMYVREAVGHLHYFSKETAIATLEDSGYDVIDFFYTAGRIELPNRALKTKLAAIPRKIAYSMNKDWAVKVLGGYSLMTLTTELKPIH